MLAIWHMSPKTISVQKYTKRQYVGMLQKLCFKQCKIPSFSVG